MGRLLTRWPSSAMTGTAKFVYALPQSCRKVLAGICKKALMQSALFVGGGWKGHDAHEYPFTDAANRELYHDYRTLAWRLDNVLNCGRLGVQVLRRGPRNRPGTDAVTSHSGGHNRTRNRPRGSVSR